MFHVIRSFFFVCFALLNEKYRRTTPPIHIQKPRSKREFHSDHGNQRNRLSEDTSFHRGVSSFEHDFVAYELFDGSASVDTNNRRMSNVQWIDSTIHSISANAIRVHSDCFRTMRIEWVLSDRLVRVINRNDKHCLWMTFVPTICLIVFDVFPASVIDLWDSIGSWALAISICLSCHVRLSYVFGRY